MGSRIDSFGISQHVVEISCERVTIYYLKDSVDTFVSFRESSSLIFVDILVTKS